ncbi:MAG TPA: anti-sigma factor [Rhizobiaceae bacterium]|nr:anti-sigma factor [Rhizobiaceae bacterium]
MSETEKMSRRDELEALLPFYLNGTLTGAELKAVEDWLQSDPDAVAALGEAELEFSGATESNEAIRTPPDALSRFTRALEREAGPARDTSTEPWFVSMWNRVMGLPAGLAWATAAAAIALLMIQAVVDRGRDPGGIEIAGSEDDLAKAPFALIVFKADAKMSDVASFLAANGAVIISGPTVGGVFRIALPVETVADYDKLFGLIAAQPFVESATPGRKPVDGGS